MRIGRRPLHPVHAITGFVVALLIFMQGLAAYASASPHVQHGISEAGAIASSSGALCQVDAIGSGGESPVHDHGDCLQCCVLCGARDYGAPPIYVATGDIGAPFQASVASTPIIRRFIDNDDGRPIGWASSWSSRAPPALS